MRVLFVSNPGIGHVFPMVPLAWALRTQGHQVLVATMGDALAPTAHAGLPVADVRPGFDRRAQLERMFRENPDEVRERLRERLTDLREVAHRFARLSAIMVDGLVTVADAWRPDVIVQS